MSVETETINKLFLELSQFTTATTAKEGELRGLIAEIACRLKSIDLKGGLGHDVHQSLRYEIKRCEDALR